MRLMDINHWWRLRMVGSEIDHMYGRQSCENETVLCSGFSLSKTGYRLHQVSTQSDDINYLHPANSQGVSRAYGLPSEADTPINECPRCLQVMTMLELAE